MAPSSDRVCVGMITAAHGVRGLVRVKPFTEDPAAVTGYGPVTDADGARTFALDLLSAHKGQWIARLEGVTDRNQAEALRGTRLYVDRTALPPPEEDEFYYVDLIGLAAVAVDGTALGRVRGVFDFGAGDVVEIALGDGGTLVVPFTRQAVPSVDIDGGRIVVDPPAVVAADDAADPRPHPSEG